MDWLKVDKTMEMRDRLAVINTACHMMEYGRSRVYEDVYIIVSI